MEDECRHIEDIISRANRLVPVMERAMSHHVCLEKKASAPPKQPGKSTVKKKK